MSDPDLLRYRVVEQVAIRRADPSAEAPDESRLDPRSVAACRRAVDALADFVELDLGFGAEPTTPELPEDYELLGEIGRGGMGVVYRARHHSLDRDVAVKVLRPGEIVFGEMVRRFEREAKSLAKLRHPNIVAIHDVGRTGDNVFYTMDLIEGRSLDRVLSDGPMTPTRAVRLMIQIATAIEHSHAHDVVHRDLKPANVLVDESGDAFVADFGLARDLSLQTDLTATGAIVGTPAYMSPEAVRGDASRIGETTDTYALGAILYECLTGRPPIEGRSAVEVMHAVLAAEPVAPRRIDAKVPRDLELICLKALAKDPEARYSTARALIEELERFREGLPVLAQRPRFSRRAWRFVLRQRAAVISALVAAVLVAVGSRFAPSTSATPDVVDDIIRSAYELEIEAEDPAAALRQYRVALALLGDDRSQRPHRPSENAWTDPLDTVVWRGLLRCEAELALRAADPHGAAEQLEAELNAAPATLDRSARRHAARALSLLRIRAGDADAAARVSRPYLVPSRDARTGEPSIDRHAVQYAFDGVADLLREPSHPHWRSAGRWLGRLFELEAEGALGGELDFLFVDADPACALTAVLPVANQLVAAARETLLARLHDFALGRRPVLQWGRGTGAPDDALEAVAADPRLPADTRTFAIDLLCQRLDLPWRANGVAEASAIEAAVERVRIVRAASTRADRYREAVRWAIEQLRSGSEPDALRGWLEARTGRREVGWQSWWVIAGDDDPLTWLEAAFGSALPASRDAALAELSASPSRRLLHEWLTLTTPTGERVPVWPADRPEPDNLVRSWTRGLASDAGPIRIRLRWTRFAPDGTTADDASSWSMPLRPGVPERIAFGQDAFSMADLRLTAILRHVPRGGFAVPGLMELDVAALRPTSGTHVDAELAWAEDGYVLRWSAAARGTEWSRRSEQRSMALGKFDAWVCDGWNSGFDGTTVGVGLLAVTAARAGTEADWSRALRRELAAIDAPSSPADAVAALKLAGRRGLFGALPHLPFPEHRDQLRRVDAIARRWWDRLDEMAVASRDDASVRLASWLPARLLAGDASALTEPGFEERFAVARRGLELGPWWWYRLWLNAEDDALAGFAARELRAAELPAPLLRHAAARSDRKFPGWLTQRIREKLFFDANRRWTGLGLIALFDALALWLAVMVFADLRRVARGRATRGWPAVALVSIGITFVIVDVRFGLHLLLPYSVGLIAITVGVIAVLAAGPGRIGALSVVALGIASGAAAVHQLGIEHAVAPGVATLFAAIGLGLLPASLRLRASPWVTIAAALALVGPTLVAAWLWLRGGHAAVGEAVFASGLAQPLYAVSIGGLAVVAVFVAVAFGQAFGAARSRRVFRRDRLASDRSAS